jgi:uncharacterized tellurite resistance protein B-like protein
MAQSKRVRVPAAKQAAKSARRWKPGAPAKSARKTSARRAASHASALEPKPAHAGKKRAAKRPANPKAGPRGKTRTAAHAAPPRRASGHGASSRSNGGTHATPPRRRSFRLPRHLAGSPDIGKHPWEHRRDYLILVAAIAASDSELHPDELKLLHAWMDNFALPPQAREEVLRVANRGDVDLLEIAKRLTRTDFTWSVMLDMMGMAMADGVLMDDEIYLLRGLAGVLGIDSIDFNILIEFVHSAHQAAQLSNPEPLYEHAIESAFQLLARRRVRLFQHTRLCVNFPEYDQQLKQRWTQYAGSHAHA